MNQKGTNRQTIMCQECHKIVVTNRDKESIPCPHCDMEICTNCGGLIKPEYENNGFQAPDPEHWEITGGTCINCGHKIIY